MLHMLNPSWKQNKNQYPVQGLNLRSPVHPENQYDFCETDGMTTSPTRFLYYLFGCFDLLEGFLYYHVMKEV